MKMPVAEMVNTDLLIQEIKTLPKNRIAQVLDFVEFIKHQEARTEKGEECPICARHRNPVTGEPLYNAETIAAIEEGKAMMTGEKPTKWYNSLEEMMTDLDSDD